MPAVESPERALQHAHTQHGESIAQISGRQPVLLLFLRHLGCTFCREALADVAARRKEIESSGAAIAIVHMSSDAEAEAAFEPYKLGDVLRVSDPDHGLYRAMGLQRAGMAQVASPGVIVRGIAASAPRWLGGGGHWPGGIKGDTLQMPGVFLIRDGRIVRAHRHRTAADRPDYCSIACELPSGPDGRAPA
jgi:peroxiredoxin